MEVKVSITIDLPHYSTGNTQSITAIVDDLGYHITLGNYSGKWAVGSSSTFPTNLTEALAYRHAVNLAFETLYQQKLWHITVDKDGNPIGEPYSATLNEAIASNENHRHNKSGNSTVLMNYGLYLKIKDTD